MNTSPLGASAIQMLLSGAMLLAIGTALGEWKDLAFTTRTAWAMIYLVLMGSIVGYSAYVYALRQLPISTVSLYAYVNPIIAVALGALMLGEPFNLRIVAASALVFAGVAVVRSRGRSPAEVTTKPAPYTAPVRDACATR
jgi:drug/metabolite transporter (DMT)-like permease